MHYARQLLFLFLLGWLAWLMYSAGVALSRYKRGLLLKVLVILGAFGLFAAAIFTKLGQMLAALDDVGPSDMPAPFDWPLWVRAGVLIIIFVVPAICGLINAERKKRVQSV